MAPRTVPQLRSAMSVPPALRTHAPPPVGQHRGDPPSTTAGLAPPTPRTQVFSAAGGRAAGDGVRRSSAAQAFDGLPAAQLVRELEARRHQISSLEQRLQRAEGRLAAAPAHSHRRDPPVESVGGVLEQARWFERTRLGSVSSGEYAEHCTRWAEALKGRLAAQSSELVALGQKAERLRALSADLRKQLSSLGPEHQNHAESLSYVSPPRPAAPATNGGIPLPSDLAEVLASLPPSGCPTIQLQQSLLRLRECCQRHRLVAPSHHRTHSGLDGRSVSVSPVTRAPVRSMTPQQNIPPGTRTHVRSGHGSRVHPLPRAAVSRSRTVQTHVRHPEG